MRRLQRAAALLLAGFAAGYGASGLVRAGDVEVVPPLHLARVTLPGVHRFVVCETSQVAVP